MNLYRGYDQEELDRRYNQRSLVPDSARYSNRWSRKGERVRARLNLELDVRYGPAPDEKLDVFPGGEGAPVIMYLHGGAWTRRSKSDAS